METFIPDIILKDVKARTFAGGAMFGGEYNDIPYFYYYRVSQARYSGLPSIVKLVNGKIEDVTALGERLRACNYVITSENKY